MDKFSKLEDLKDQLLEVEGQLQELHSIERSLKTEIQKLEDEMADDDNYYMIDGDGC